MGLFDDVRVDYPLPEPKYQELSFQTKDLGQRMEQYRISAEGRLLQQRYRDEPIPEAEQKPNWLGTVHTQRMVPHSWHDEEYHGDIVFYECLMGLDRRPMNRGGHDGKGWVQYRARFTDGQLVWIRPDDLRRGDPPPND